MKPVACDRRWDLDEGAVEGCDDVGRVVEGTELEDGSLKESLRLVPPRAARQK